MEMEDVFISFAKESPVVMKDVTNLQPKSTFSSKRALSEADCETPRKPMCASSKSKLMGNPISCSGFGAPREKLNIGQNDVTYVEGPNGSAMRISAELKENSTVHEEKTKELAGTSGKQFQLALYAHVDLPSLEANHCKLSTIS
ncbi:hypothetical protein ACOSQ2_024231 [Xanthoceras sorbifolium]